MEDKESEGEDEEDEDEDLSKYKLDEVACFIWYFSSNYFLIITAILFAGSR